MEIIRQYRGLPRQIYLLLVARIIAAMGAFVFPFLTMFLSGRLGLSEVEIGKYLLLVAASYVPAALLGGKLADRFSRKTIYIGAMVLCDICFFTTGFYCDQLLSIWLILAGYFFMNMGQPVLSAMMMDLTDPSNRQESFSLIYLGLNLGIAFGPLVAGFLFEKYTPWIFWGQAALNLVAMCIIGFFVQDTTPDQSVMEEISADESRAAEAASGETLWQALRRTPVVICFAVLSCAYTFGYAQLSFILPLQMEDVYGLAMGSKYIGSMWSLNGLAVFLGTPLFVLLLKKLSPLLNLSLAGLCFAAGFGLYALSGNLFLFYGLVLVWTAGEIVSATNSGVFIANHAPVSHRARFQSIYDIIHGTGRALGPLLMGYFLAVNSKAAAWMLVGGLCLLAAAGFFAMYRVAERRHSRT